MTKTIAVTSPLQENVLMDKAFDIFKRRVEKKSEIKVTKGNTGDLEVCFLICEGIGKEGYCISAESDGTITVSGNDWLGLLYGIGKLLRCVDYDAGKFILGDCTGISIPEKNIRGMYFATHFHNYYHDAPIEEVEEYIEDIVLWGTNILTVWFDMHDYKSINDAKAVKMISRIHEILDCAKRLGLKTSMTLIANESFAGSPEELRADWTSGHDGYERQLLGHYHIELCPNKPGSEELLLKWREDVFHAFSDIGLDYIWIWPYDQGGCTCNKCKPWGVNGFLKIAKVISGLAKSVFPGVKVILSTWLFDHFTSGEWDGLAEAFKERPDWVDYILADCPEGMEYPKCICENKIPGDLPFIGFPEISMFGAVPWGGFGANPLPLYLQNNWNRIKNIQSGGFPYSEGIFEDINKVICTQLYWGEFDSVVEILKEYIRYEFSLDLEEDILNVILLMEKTITRHRVDEKGKIHDYPDFKIPWIGEQRFVIENPENIDEVYKLTQQINVSLNERVRNSWRWRIIYLRGIIDYELYHNNFKSTERCEMAFKELINIYHAENGDYSVTPPTKESICENRGDFSWF